MILDTDTIRSFSAHDYLGKEFECTCGRKHSVGVQKIVVGCGALREIPQTLKELGCSNVLMVADSNTYEAAGKAVEQLLAKDNVTHKSLVYVRQSDLVPDEEAIGELFVAVEDDTDIIVAVGSGVINDLSKYVGTRLGLPVVIVATAPSMDGYASDTAALILDNLKTSVEVHTVKAIIGDVNILKAAPMDMILAGVGDMLGKYSALRDWQLGQIVVGEYYCDKVADIVRLSVKKCIDSIDALENRDEAAVGNLMEGLVLSGIAMSFVGNSRPASGSEHHVSHYWENAFLQERREAILHGTKVGISTVIMSRICEELVVAGVDYDMARSKVCRFDENKWRADVERLYQKAAPGIIKQSIEYDRNSPHARLRRIDTIERNWGQIVEVLGQSPSSAEIEGILASAGAATLPKQIGIDNEMVYNSIVYAKEIRPRYTVLQLLWDLGLSEQFASSAAQD